MSDSEGGVSDTEDGDYGGYVEEKETPKPPPPKGPRGPKTPEQEIEGKMKLAIHKIGAGDMAQADMDALWGEGVTGHAKYAEVLKTDVIQNLLSEKLRYCATLGNLHSLEFLHGKGGDINSVEEFTGNTALMVATGVTHDFDKQKLIITYLMSHGADCNIKNKYGLTPKSAIPGFKDSPSVTHCREMDLKVKDSRAK